MNYLDYLDWRGDLSLKVDPFNIVDNLLFSEISYLNFDGIVSKEEISLKEAARLYFEKNGDDKDASSILKNQQTVLRKMTESARFSDCVIYNYVNILNKDRTTQFSAVSFILPDRTHYIAFRGTDDYLVSWKEDFQMSYKEVNAQKEALNYLNNTFRVFRKYRVGGHSKGGNLALYSACKCLGKNQKKIIAVYNNDGPGLSDDLFNKDEFDAIKDRYHKIMPESDVVGSIYNRIEKPVIVRAKGNILAQHYMSAWHVTRDGFKEADKFDKGSLTIVEAMNEFLADSDKNQRETFVEEVFKALAEAGIEKIADLKTGGLQVLVKVVGNLTDINQISKDTGAKMVKAIVEASSRNYGIKLFRGKQDV